MVGSIKMSNNVPSYWWDFGSKYNIIVESDNDKYPVLGIFSYDPNGFADKAIEKATKLIDDLESGRITPKLCLRKINHV